MDDKRIADAVEELNRATAAWLGYVYALNQCARTDRMHEMGHSILNTEEARRDFLNSDMLEGILEKADTLKKVYEEEMGNVS